MNIGVDVGGVLGSKFDSKDDIEQYLSGQPNTDVVDVMRWVVSKYSKNNVFIISTRPERMEHIFLLWLDKYGFFNEVGIDKNKVFFCRTRADKANIAKTLMIDYFIDDRVEVLEPMKGIVARRILFASSLTHETTNDTGIINLQDWNSVKKDLNRQES